MQELFEKAEIQRLTFNKNKRLEKKRVWTEVFIEKKWEFVILVCISMNDKAMKYCIKVKCTQIFIGLEKDTYHLQVDYSNN